mgnify:CR=1 FL=1
MKLGWTPSIRNVVTSPPYMHDGSLKTLRDVVVHYNNGGVTIEGDPVNDFLSGGIRPLNLTEDQIADLVAWGVGPWSGSLRGTLQNRRLESFARGYLEQLRAEARIIEK